MSCLLTYLFAKQLSHAQRAHLSLLARTAASLLLTLFCRPGFIVGVVARSVVLLASSAVEGRWLGWILGSAIPYRLGRWSHAISLPQNNFGHAALVLRNHIVSLVSVSRCRSNPYQRARRDRALPGGLQLFRTTFAPVHSTPDVQTDARSFTRRVRLITDEAGTQSMKAFPGSVGTSRGQYKGTRHGMPTRPAALVKPGSSLSNWSDRGLVVLFLGGAVTFFVACAAMADSVAWAPLVPVALLTLVLAGWLVLAAAFGSQAAIMIYFAVIVFMTDAQFRVRGAGDISADWQSALKFAIWLGAGMIGVCHLPPLRTLLARPASACLLTYITMAIVSSLYSPTPGYSFGCALALLCLFSFAYALTTKLSQTQILWTLLLALTAFNICGWIVFFALPDLGSSASWTQSGLLLRMCGLAGQATNLGAVCAKAVGAAFVLWYTRRCGLGLALLLGGFAFATLLKSDARTTEAAAVLGVGLIIASRYRLLMVGGAFLAAISLISIELFPSLMDVVSASFSRSGDPTELYTLTGRLEIWDFAIQQIHASPIFGWGYNSSKVVLGSHIGFDNGLMVDAAHNLYLQNLLSVGILGTIPLLLLLVHLVWRCVRQSRPFVVYTLVVVLISSVSDTDTIGTTPTLMTMVFFVVVAWVSLEEVPSRHLVPSREWQHLLPRSARLPIYR